MPVYASGEAIPDYLMMDTRGLKSGDKIMASDIAMNDGIMLVRHSCGSNAQRCRAIMRRRT